MRLPVLLLPAWFLMSLASAPACGAPFGPSNPFYRESTLPFHAPAFDRIRDADYEPAIEAGMASQRREVEAIANNRAPPTFANTIVALERTGALLHRARAAFNGVTEANTNPELQRIDAALAPKFAAHEDAIRLNRALFARIESLYERRERLHLDDESLRLLEVTYRAYVHAGAKLDPGAQAKLKELNSELATLSNQFSTRLLAATKQGAFATTDRAALAGLGDGAIAAAENAARARGVPGYVLPLQNTTQQPALEALTVRATRQALFERSYERAERGDENDTRALVVRIAALRAERAALLGFPTHAAWKIENQMAKTPEAALGFLTQLAPYAVAAAGRESVELQQMITAEGGDFHVAPWDWTHYASRYREAHFGIDAEEVKAYFELGRVLQDGVFYAAHELYGITFKERRDLPVYQKDVRVFEVSDVNGKPLALFYADYFKRDNKNGGAWMGTFVAPSGLLHHLPVIYNVANLPAPAPGQPALISFDDVRTMFHEFGHALHAIFSTGRYPTLAGTTAERDFVEFPSQFNEYWAVYPSVLAHYARHYQTGEPMPKALLERVLAARDADRGYALTELLAAAVIDLEWHTKPAGGTPTDVDAFEREALARAHLDLEAVPPRYRTSYFSHVWASGYSAGYYAYAWTQMLADDAYQWFDEHGGLTRANGDRFRAGILSRGDTRELGALYRDWRGRAPTIGAMLHYRGLDAPAP